MSATTTDKIPHCPVCHSHQTRYVILRARTSVFECETCSVNYANIDATDVIDTDPDFYHGINENYENQLRKAKEILPARIAEYEKITGAPIKSVIEVGCATGAYAEAFLELGIEYTGVEIEEENAFAAKKRTGANIIHANFMDLEFENKFDVFFCSQVLEHVPNPVEFVKKAANVTSKGVIHIDVPNHNSLAADLRKKFSKTDYGFIQPPYHMIAYNADSLSHLLKSCGLAPLFCKAYRNDDIVWGQLVSDHSIKQRAAYLMADMLGKGSLLVAVCKT